MAENCDVAGQVLALMDTMGEGLDYLDSRITDGRLEESIFLLKDINDALQAVSQACTHMPAGAADEASIQNAAADFKRCLDELARACEDSGAGKARFELQTAVLPAYKRWDELTRSFLSPVSQSE